MSVASDRLREQLLDLLAARATEGLDGDELVELGRLLEALPEVDEQGMERAAAAIDLALAAIPAEPLPPSLARRIAATAPRHRSQALPASAEASRPRRRARRTPWLAAAGWIAAAAALAFALFGSPAAIPRSPTDPAAARRALLASAPDAVVVPWTATGDPAGPQASGDVVWSTARQQGFLRIRGLAENDPSRSEYQLWIFDSKRDSRYPVDGGVFDVRRKGGDVIVPIHAVLPVAEPTLFAVTVERPGGVVVSSRARLPLVAKLGG